MKRAAGILVVLIVGIAMLVGAGGQDDSYRVDAILSNASSLIPGQDVQIAGAVVGAVEDVSLTRDNRARIAMKVQTGFAPFRGDARCEVKPQSLIGEKFIACDPGTPDAHPLPEREGIPTVPLEQTSAPVDIDLVFAALRQPYVQRLSLIVNELGTGLAGRPRELQAAIRRAAPALEETYRVLELVNRDRDLLGRLIERTDTVLAELAPRDGDVMRFIESAERVATEVAERRDALGLAVDRLPPLLRELEPSARSLASVSRGARPVVRALSRATPSLRRLWSDLDPLTEAGRPALAALRSASDQGRRAVRVARPIAQRLQPAAKLIPHVAEVVEQVTRSLRESGGVEGIQEFVWLAAAATARFDATSHIIPSYQVSGLCNTYATEPVDGCSAHWKGSPAAEAAAAERERRRARRPARRGRERDDGQAQTEQLPTEREQGGRPQQPPLPELPQIPGLPELPKLPQLPGLTPGGDRGDTAERLLDFLMGS